MRRAALVLPHHLWDENPCRSKRFEDVSLPQHVAVRDRLDAGRSNLDHHRPVVPRTTEGEAGGTAGERADVGDTSAGESPTQLVEVELDHSAHRFRPADFGEEGLGVRDAPGHGLRIAGAQQQGGLGDQFNVLGVGLGQV